jgi:hypothetical protein
LVVLVHGCCTDEKDVKEWESLGMLIAETIIQNQAPEVWEIVVLDWSYDTPEFGLDFQNAALRAYENALFQGPDLAIAIANHPYKHVHLIGHSSGAKLIDVAAKELILRYKEIQNNEERPFIHLTFLDAYTPYKMDEDTYGFLVNYPNHYSEHYVDRTPAALFTNAILTNAFNFNITRWKPHLDPLNDPIGHQWPRYWYEKSVTSPRFRYGYPLSLEDGNDPFSVLANYPAGKRCILTRAKDVCVPQ